MSARTFRMSHVRVALAVVLGGALLIEANRTASDRVANQPESAAVVVKAPSPSQAFASPVKQDLRLSESLDTMAAKDPVGFLEFALDRYDRGVRDYTCTFTKQERIHGELSKEQIMRAMFREKPFSVRLEWTKNEDKCSRVLYVVDKWVENGQQLAVIEPGAIARLFVPYVMRPICGADAKKSSRRTIDQFGLRNSLTMILKYCKLSREQGILDFTYKGLSQANGRETLMFERRLPYIGEDGQWPDRVLEVHIDKEWLLPTLCLCYADDNKQILLGKYQTSDIKLNPNLPESTFTKEGMGL